MDKSIPKECRLSVYHSEEASHLIFSCPVLRVKRAECFRTYLIDYDVVKTNWKVNSLVKFINETSIKDKMEDNLSQGFVRGWLKLRPGLRAQLSLGTPLYNACVHSVLLYLICSCPCHECLKYTFLKLNRELQSFSNKKVVLQSDYFVLQSQFK